MKEDATQEEMDKVKEDIRALDGISTIEFVSKEQGLNTMKEKTKRRKRSIRRIQCTKNKSILHSKVTDLERSKTIQSEVEKIDNVVKITNSNETAMKLISIAKSNKNSNRSNFITINYNINIYNFKHNKINSTLKKKRNINNEICRSNKQFYKMAIYSRRNCNRNNIKHNINNNCRRNI